LARLLACLIGHYALPGSLEQLKCNPKPA
jgi:hypothetical protein